ncbi:MAG: glycoside hydrolase family 30 protein [Acidobacteriaceae bacterium]
MKMNRRDFVRGAAVAAAAGAAPKMVAEGMQPGAVVDVTVKHQQMDGFGFSEAFGQSFGLWRMPEEKREYLLDLMFDEKKGMGFTILRNIIQDGGMAKGAVHKAGGEAGESIEPEQGTWNWKGDKGQIWLMGEAKKRGCGRFFSTAWSPPAWMKTTHEVNRGGQLRTDMYPAFADYLAEYVLGYKKHFGIDIYAVSPANEPDYLARWPSCIWSGEQLAVFLRTALIPTFERRGVGAEIIVNEDARWTDLSINTILDDPTCAKALNIVAAHAYTDDYTPYVPLAKRTGVFRQALSMGKRVWETEVSADGKNITNITDGVYWARLVHAHLAVDQVSGWLWWWGASMAEKSRGSLIGIDPRAGTFEVAKRFYTIGQFAKFIRPGAQRVEATAMPDTDVDLSAYHDAATGRTVVVAINRGMEERRFPVTLKGVTGGKARMVRTSATENHAEPAAVPVKMGGFRAVAAAESVTTWVIG